MINWKKLEIVHPFLFAAFPVLFLYSHNVNQVKLTETFLPLLIVIVFAILLLLLFILFTKDKEKAGIIVSILMLLFFSYGYVSEVINGMNIGELVVGTHKYQIIIWSILFVSGVFLIIRTRRNLNNLTGFLNIVAVFLCLISIGTSVYAYPRKGKLNRENNSDTTSIIDSGKRPDIYYIILDAYARGDVLKEKYQYDNAEFLNRLSQKGFFISDNSRANYAYTLFSLTSSLNSTYLDDLVNRYGPESNNTYWPALKMINNNSVFKFLKQRGYRIVIVPTIRFLDDAIKTADIYIKAPFWSMTQFQSELINSTPIPILLKALSEKTKIWGDFRYDRHRERILYFFDHLPDMAKTKRDYPVFVFAHMIAPHAPFVFGKNGEKINPDIKFHLSKRGYNKDEYMEQYRNQLLFVNKKIEKAIDNILSNSPEPPIIILQADHGPASLFLKQEHKKENLNKRDFKERMSILNAYYFPDNEYEKLYKEITPVNTFRVIFNQYFDANYELLKDESYFSSSISYKFINVTSQLK